MEYEYELKLSGGKTVTWIGKDGINAAERYTDCHKGVAVFAWRLVAYGLFNYNHNIHIIE